ncbi:hypothetical protein IV102_38065 [bacterium]|nr:hypothetical protein [bacterium]
MELNLWLGRSFLWPFALLLCLKFWARPQAGWLVFGLVLWWGGLVADVAVPAMGLYHPVGPTYPLAALVIVALLTTYLSVRLARRPGILPPSLAGGRSRLLRTFRAFFWGVGLLQFLALLLFYSQPACLQPGLASACLGTLGGSVLVSEGRRTWWRGLGLVSVARPWLAWIISLICVGLWFSGGTQYWLLVPVIVRVRPVALHLSPNLTPCRATLLLRLPLPTVNRCLELIPLQLQTSWFRPDATRLHLREPLLETQNAPGYFAALAEFISHRYELCVCTQQQLADFCLRFPDSAARAVLAFPLDQAQDAPAGWDCNNLATLRKSGQLMQLWHLLLLRRIVQAVVLRP